jgi:hypothetical protein
MGSKHHSLQQMGLSSENLVAEAIWAQKVVPWDKWAHVPQGIMFLGELGVVRSYIDIYNHHG